MKSKCFRVLQGEVVVDTPEASSTYPPGWCAPLPAAVLAANGSQLLLLGTSESWKLVLPRHTGDWEDFSQ